MATILSLKTATGSATSSLELAVRILPPVTTRSALSPATNNLLVPPVIARLIQKYFDRDETSTRRGRIALQQNRIRLEITAKMFFCQDVINNYKLSISPM